MFVTSLTVPTLEQVKALNARTKDGDGTLAVSECDGKVRAIFDMEASIFQDNPLGYDYEDALVLGLAWAYLIANEHIFFNGNKSTATLVLKFIVEGNGRRFTCDDARLKDVVNGMVPDDDEEGPNLAAIGDAAEMLKGFCV